MTSPFPFGQDDVLVDGVTARPISNGSYFVFRGKVPHLGILGMVHPVGSWPDGQQWWVAFYLNHDPITLEEATYMPAPVMLARDLEPPVAGWGRSVEEAAAHLAHPR